MSTSNHKDLAVAPADTQEKPQIRIDRRLAGWLSIAGVVLLIDQLTKYVVVSELYYAERIQVLPFFAWVRWHNEGAAFSFLAQSGGWQRWFFVILALAFSAYLLWELARLPRTEKALGWVFSLILGGALGNMVDRWSNGYVVDFLLFHYTHYEFPAFNVADTALFCGVALWILLMILEYRQAKRLSDQQ